MLKVESKWEFSIELKETYRLSANNNDYNSLHQYILCLLNEDKFVDSEGNVDITLIEELNHYLEQVVNSDKAESYEILFYYELNRALGNEKIINDWFEKYPDYMEFCKICIHSYEFLAYVGLFEAASICCKDVYNATLINEVEYIKKYSDLLIRKGEMQAAFDYLVTTIEDKEFRIAPTIISKATFLARELDKQEKMLEMFRRCVSENEKVKWISRDYIGLCIENDLLDEAKVEYVRLQRVINYVYERNPVTIDNLSLFKYFCEIRKIMGMEYDENIVAEEIGVTLQLDETRNKQQGRKITNYKLPWGNDFNGNGNKGLLKRVNKMNKPLKTYFKVFSGGEKEIIYSKSILGNYISIINNRFKMLFGTEKFIVNDYNLFYEAFPFYSLNEFTEEEIIGAVKLLQRIHANCINLNPYVMSRSFPIDTMLKDTLSVNTNVEFGNNMYAYKVCVSESSQLTVFGAILLMSTFMTTCEKETFAFELAGSDVKLTSAMLKQVLKTIPPSTISTRTGMNYIEASHEKSVFSLFVRRESIRFLLELEHRIIKEFDLLDTDVPNMNCKYFNQLLGMKYSPDSDIYMNIMKLHKLANSGIGLGECVEDEKFTIGNIVRLLKECCDKDDMSEIFQAGIEALFILCVNRKYYSQMKWSIGRNNGTFLKNTDNYCRKMLYRNEELMTQEDEEFLYNGSKEHVFTYLDDTQVREFTFGFKAKALEWEQITIHMYRVLEGYAIVKINGEEIEGEYFMPAVDDKVEVIGINGQEFKGWKKTICLESPIAKHIMYEAEF